MFRLLFKLKDIGVISLYMIVQLPDRPWFSLAILIFNNLFNGRTKMFDIENNEKRKKESSLILRKAKFQAIFKFVLSSASGGAGGGKYNRISVFVSMPVLLIRRSLEFFNSLTSYARDSLIFATQKRNDGNMKNRDDSFCFGFAKILALALLFTIFTITESSATDKIPTSGTCNTAGTCLWSLGSDGTLTIFAKNGAKDVKMANYSCSGNPCEQSSLVARPWEANLQQIKSIVIGDNITHIGNDAFQNATNLKSVTGMKDVNTIGHGAVFGYTGLTSFTIPDSITKISDNLFRNSTILTELIIPDNLIDNNVVLSDVMFNLSCFPSRAANPSCANAKIVCQGDVEKCKNALAKFGGNGNCSLGTKYCINPKNIVAANYQQCSGNYFWNGASCIREPDLSKRKCCSSCKDMGGYCNRIRYTPAEAAPLLNDNNNSVTITFKK